MVVDLQGVAFGADLDGVVAGRLRSGSEKAAEASPPAGTSSDLLLRRGGRRPATRPPGGSAAGGRSSSGGLEGDAAAHHGHGLDRPQAGDGEVLGRRLSQVDHAPARPPWPAAWLCRRKSSGGRFAQLRRPGGPLQVGEEVDLDWLQPGVLAAGPLHQLSHGGDAWPAGRRRCASSSRLSISSRHGAALEGRRAHHHPRRRGHQDQREGVALRALLDDPRGQFLGALEAALVGRRGRPSSRSRRSPARDGSPPPRLKASPLRSQKRLRHDGQHHQHDQERAQHQEQPLLQSAAAASAAAGRPAGIPSPPRASRGSCRRLHKWISSGAAAAASQPSSRRTTKAKAAGMGSERRLGIEFGIAVRRDEASAFPTSHSALRIAHFRDAK